MKSNIPRIARAFVIVFAVIVTVIVVTQMIWINPGKECEAAGNWWDWRERTCARPILISDITGRVIDTPEARAAAKAAKARADKAAAAAKAN